MPVVRKLKVVSLYLLGLVAALLFFRFCWVAGAAAAVAGRPIVALAVSPDSAQQVYVHGAIIPTPAAMLAEAASRPVAADADGAALYGEFLDAMAAQPFVAQAFDARYGEVDGFADPAARRAGLDAFRAIYRREATRLVPADALPAAAEALVTHQKNVIDDMLGSDNRAARRVDAVVIRAIRGR